jgi:hypothetical protein
MANLGKAVKGKNTKEKKKVGGGVGVAGVSCAALLGRALCDLGSGCRCRCYRPALCVGALPWSFSLPFGCMMDHCAREIFVTGQATGKEASAAKRTTFQTDASKRLAEMQRRLLRVSCPCPSLQCTRHHPFVHGVI